MTIAIIAARGGSKRIPRKNLKPFCGIPLVGWAIIQSLCSKHIDRVYVTTDDDEIEAVSKQYGAKVIRRPDWPDADLVAANRPYIHAMQELQKEYGGAFNTVITLLPTTPLNLPGDLDKAIELYREYGCDTIRPLRPLREIVILKKTHPLRCRCDLFDKKYSYLGEAGGYIVTSPQWYINFNSKFSDIDSVLDNMENWPGRESYFFPVEYWQYADVDTIEEFEYAEIVMNHFILKGSGDKVYWDYFNNQFISGIDNAQKFGGD